MQPHFAVIRAKAGTHGAVKLGPRLRGGDRLGVVQAKDDRARAFYLACAEFVEFPAESRVLFLAVETVVGAVG